MSNVSQIDLYYTFYCLAKHSSFEDAMKELGVSRSTIYRKIKELETLYQKGDLIHNHTKGGVSLTLFGESVFEKISSFINVVEVEQEKLLSHAALLEKKDVIKIITTSGFTSLLLVNAIVKYKEKNPNTVFEVQVIEKSFLPDKHVFDIAFFPEFFVNKQKYIVEKTEKVILQWFASEKYLGKHGIPSELSDLENHNVIKFHLDELEIRGPSDQVFFDNIVPHAPHLSINSFLCRIYAISIGYGIACLPLKITELIDLPFVKLDKLPNKSADIIVISPKPRHHQDHIREFFTFAVKEIRSFLQ